MGYLKNKQKQQYETFDIIKVKDLPGLVFRFKSVHMADIEGDYGIHKTAVCNIVIGDKPFTVFIDKGVIVKILQEGLDEGHDWADGVEYVVDKIRKKKSDGEYWIIREADDSDVDSGEETGEA